MIKRIIASLLVLCMCLSGVRTYARENNVLRVGVNVPYEPYEYYSDGELTGYEIDVMEAAASILGYEIEWIEYEYEELLPGVVQGMLDCAVSLSPTEERAEFVSFTRTYILNEDSDFNYAAAVAKDNNALLSELNYAISEMYDNAELYSLMKKYGLKIGDGYNFMKDIANGDAPSDWAAEEVERAAANGLVTEKVTRNYHADITREQFCETVVLAYEAISKKTAEVGTEEFYDTDNEEILKAAQLGIVTGYGNGLFGPYDKITREQIAAMLVRMLAKAVPELDIYDYGEYRYADEDEISDWALPSVNFAYENDIMRGVGDMQIKPLSYTTCEEAILLINRVYEKYSSYESSSSDGTVMYIDEEMYYTVPAEGDIISEDDKEFVGNQLIINAKQGTPKSKIENILSEYGGKIVGEIAITDTYQAELTGSYTYDELKNTAEELSSCNCVEFAELNYAFPNEPSFIPNDEKWRGEWGDEFPDGKNWGVEAIKADKAWDYASQMDYVNIGVIDNCFLEHEDLEFEDTLFNFPDTVSDTKHHGTHVGGIIGASFDNERGISGVLPTARLYGVSMKSEPDIENLQTAMSYKIALTYLIATKKCKAINISMTYGAVKTYATQHDPEWQSVHNLYAADMAKYLKILLKLGNEFVICVAAGNDNSDAYMSFPSAKYGYIAFKEKGSNAGTEARYASMFAGIEDKDIRDRIIVVGACKNSGGGRYEYSAFSDIGSRVDVVAPGEEIYSTKQGKKYIEARGTSMAAPYVTGLAGMLFAADSSLTGKQVKEIIADTANVDVSGFDKRMINAEAALNRVLNDGIAEEEETDFSEKDTSYDSSTMGREDFIAYDEKYYYYKNSEGHLTREAKDGSELQEMYEDEFRYVCAVDKSYVYVLAKNGNLNRLIRISKDTFTSETLLSDVCNVHWQDDKYIYLTSSLGEKDIYKYDRKKQKLEQYQSFEYPVIRVMPYESEASGKHYVITDETDFLSAVLGETKNHYYVTDKNGNIIKDCGDASEVSDYYIWEYPNYTLYSRVITSNYGSSKRSDDVRWKRGNSSEIERVESASGWRNGEYGIVSMKAEDTLYSLVLNKAEDGSEFIISNENEKHAYKKIIFGENDNYYFLHITPTGKDSTIFGGKIGSPFASMLGIFYGDDDMMLQLMGDWIMVFSNDDTSEAQLQARFAINGLAGERLVLK